MRWFVKSLGALSALIAAFCLFEAIAEREAAYLFGAFFYALISIFLFNVRRTASPFEPPAELAAMDPRSQEAIEWALFCTLGCVCEVCNFELELLFWNDPPWNGDEIAWSKEMAPEAQSLGWSMAPDCFNLVCPKCQPA